LGSEKDKSQPSPIGTDLSEEVEAKKYENLRDCRLCQSKDVVLSGVKGKKWHIEAIVALFGQMAIFG
jgi:hypothetical protein